MEQMDRIIDGQDGTNGLNAYEIAVQNGFVGTEAEWLASLQGTDGQNGADGQDGTDGTNGLSAYEINIFKMDLLVLRQNG